MSTLAKLNELIEGLGIPVETGVFSDEAPDEYVVLTPLTDVFVEHADDRPQFETQEVRISLFSKGNYRQRTTQVVKGLLDAGITVTERAYVGREDDTGYHNYAIDVQDIYGLE